MFCGNCGNKLSDNANFCNGCGTKVNVVKDAFCSSCGNKLVSGATFCANCGTKVVETDAITNVPQTSAPTNQPEMGAEEAYKRGSECLKGEVFDLSFKYFQMAAEQGHAGAQVELARMYQSGIAVSFSERHATKWYGVAAEQGNAEAQYNLALQYMKAQEVDSMSASAIQEYINKASSIPGKNSEKQDIEKCLESMKPGVEYDPVTAFRWLELSAQQGFVDAIYTLGNYYFDGTGVTTDLNKAKELYKEVIEKGSNQESIKLSSIKLTVIEIREQFNERVKEFKKQNFLNDQTAFLNAITDLFKKLTILLENQSESNSIYFVNVSKDFEKKLKGALTYAKLQERELPLIVMDSTMFGNAKEGAFFTTHALYIKPPYEKVVIIQFDNVSYSYIKELLGYKLEVNGKPFGTIISGLKDVELFKGLFIELSNILKYLHSPENSPN